MTYWSSLSLRRSRYLTPLACAIKRAMMGVAMAWQRRPHREPAAWRAEYTTALAPTPSSSVWRRTCISNATAGFSVCRYLIIEMRYPHACAANAGGIGCTDVASTRRRASPAERRAASSSGVGSGTTRRASSMSDALTPLCLLVNDASKMSSRSTMGGSAIIILSSSSRAASRDVTSLSCARSRARQAPDGPMRQWPVVAVAGHPSGAARGAGR